MKDQNKELTSLKTQMRKWRWKKPDEDLTLQWSKACQMPNKVAQCLEQERVLKLFEAHQTSKKITHALKMMKDEKIK